MRSNRVQDVVDISKLRRNVLQQLRRCSGSLLEQRRRLLRAHRGFGYVRGGQDSLLGNARGILCRNAKEMSARGPLFEGSGYALEKCQRRSIFLTENKLDIKTSDAARSRYFGQVAEHGMLNTPTEHATAQQKRIYVQRSSGGAEQHCSSESVV